MKREKLVRHLRSHGCELLREGGRHSTPRAKAQSPLSRWYTIVRKTDFKDFNELRRTFPSADWVEDLIVFNIGGNKYRLIAAIHFNRGRVYIRHVLTHEDYDRGAWKP